MTDSFDDPFVTTDDWLPMHRSQDRLTSTVTLDRVTVAACQAYDYQADGLTTFAPWVRPAGLPDTWGVGLIVGGSGTGKSTLLREFGTPTVPSWDDSSPIASHFATAEEATSRLYAVGLSSVPTWVKPARVLSTGERFRADLARQLVDGSVVDEFTSVVDRNVARSASRTVRKYVSAGHVRRMVLATCHRDVIPWLEPDWIIGTDAGAWVLNPRECLQREPLVAEIYQVTRAMWVHFMGHHYLGESLHPFARCYLATVGLDPVAFTAAIPFPNGYIKRGWRESRTVTLPDYQGLGVGPRLSDWVAEAHVRAGYRYFSRTAHPRMGEYRQRHPNWRPTSGNLKPQSATKNPNIGWGHWTFDDVRIAYSHEFILPHTPTGLADK